jgi:glc operon protein GlcG
MRQFMILAAALGIGGLASPAAAQVAEHKGLTLEGARNVIAAAAAYARTKAGTGVIAVVDEGGNLMALERLDGTFAAGANISIGKARTAALFKKPTRAFEELINKGRTAMTTVNDFTPLIGGIPILVDGQIVGAVGVSGAASAQEDEEVALAGAAAVGMQVSAGGPLRPMDVNYFTHDQVAAAFAKGGVLVDGAGRNYMVHASRREKPGQVEVHVLDTDVIYVQNGSATLVTGGTMVGGKTTEPNEVRGDSISGGETRTIARGDVITVPNGTPHWFESVSGPLTYYVVKVR